MATANDSLAVAEAVNVSPTTTEENRREHCRIPAKLPSKLFSLDGREILQFTTDEIGEGGLRFKAPIGYGLGVGQRYEVVFPEDVVDRGWANLAGDGHYATVLRTEMHAENLSDQHIVIGLRFDQPLVL
jgi:hypothetical protein